MMEVDAVIDQASSDGQTQSTKLLQPRAHKAKIVIWSDLTVADIDKLNGAVDSDVIKSILADTFGLEDAESNQRTAILLDLYGYLIQFTRKHKFNHEQISAFFSIVKKTHEVCIETPFGNIDHCFTYFRDLVLCHAVKRPPFSIELFTPEEVRAITDYVINTYFRHYKMYKYAFTPLVRLDLTMTYIDMPDPPTAEQVTDAGVEGSQSGDEDDKSTPTDGDELKEDPEREEKGQEEEKESDRDKACSELRTMIKEYMSVELKKLKINVEEKIKESEDQINERLQSVEGPQSGKGRKGSAKRKK